MADELIRMLKEWPIQHIRTRNSLVLVEQMGEMFVFLLFCYQFNVKRRLLQQGLVTGLRII